MKLYLVDGETQQVRELVPSVPTPLGLGAVSRDEKYLYASVLIEEADIWLLEFEQER